MPRPSQVEHTYLIETSDATLRWRLTVGPRTNKSPSRYARASYTSLQVIVELAIPDAPAQLEFEF